MNDISSSFLQANRQTSNTTYFLGALCFLGAMDSPPTKRRRKGGQRQRMNIASKQEDTGLQTSKLANLLLERWARGELSPQNLQATAAAVVADFEASSAKPPSDLAVLANLEPHEILDEVLDPHWKISQHNAPGAFAFCKQRLFFLQAFFYQDGIQ